MHISRKISVFYILMLLSVAVRADVAGEKLLIGSFSSGSLDHWEPKEFKGQTKYHFVDLARNTGIKSGK